MYFVRRALFQPSLKPCPHGSVHFKIVWLFFVIKLATAMTLRWKCLHLVSTLKLLLHYVKINCTIFFRQFKVCSPKNPRVTKKLFCKPSSASAIFKLPWMPGILILINFKLNNTTEFRCFSIQCSDVSAFKRQHSMFQRKGTRLIPYLSPFFLFPASHCPGSVIFLLVP